MIVGIDIGNRGGWALLDAQCRVVDTGRLPHTNDGPDETAMHELVTRWAAAGVTAVYMEGAPGNVRIQGRSNPAGLRSLALWEGIIRGACATRIRCVLVPARTWKAATLGRSAAGFGMDEKAQAIAFCRARWPDAGTWLVPKGCRVPQDGIADAAVIGAYGWTCERFATAGRAAARPSAGVAPARRRGR